MSMNRIEHYEFYELVRKYLVNKPAILAYSSAAKYEGLTYCEYVKKIEVYVEDFLPELSELKFKQIKLDSFDGIDYAEDEKGIKCCSSEKVIYDLIDKEYRNEKTIGYCSIEEICEALEMYSIKHSFSDLRFSNSDHKDFFDYCLKILQEDYDRDY